MRSGNRCQTKVLSGWGRTHRAECAVLQPTQLDEAAKIISGTDQMGIIPRGLGRSYGDVATSGGNGVLRTAALNKVGCIDESNGLLICEAGASLNQILDEIFLQGFGIPVCPGTAHITVGGAIANDVHGKSHHRNGSFGEHVEWIELLTPAEGPIRVSRNSRPDVFFATVGGIGLTGLITRAAIRMTAMPSYFVSVNRVTVTTLGEVLETLRDADQNSAHTVAWLDVSKTSGNSLRGIVQSANLVENHSPSSDVKPSLALPTRLRLPLVNRLTSSLLNGLYYFLNRSKGTSLEPFRSFNFPLDRVSNWNVLFPLNGFLQFQCVVPNSVANSAIDEFLQCMARENVYSPLAVLKSFGAESGGLLSFPAPGITLAVDMPNSSANRQLIRGLYDRVIDFGGRIYLAKDALLSASQFRAMYPRYLEFLEVKHRLDPNNVLRSDMSDRLGLTS